MEGQVLDAATGAPVKKAQITLRLVESNRGSGLGTTSDAAGRFAMKDIDPGRYRLFAERNGFVRQEYGARVAGRQGTVITLSPGQRLTEVVLRLSPQGVLSGVIVDEDSEPVAGVSVQMLKTGYRNGRKQLSLAGFSQTNDLGEYRIFGAAPGRYYLAALYRQPFGIVDRTANVARADMPEQVYAPTFYPGTTDPQSAASLDVKAGMQMSGINFTLRKMPAVRLRGTLGRTGTVYLMPRNAFAEFTRKTVRVREASGNFEIRGVLPGSYILGSEIEWEGVRYFARVPIETGAADVDGIRLTLAPGGNISGTVRVDSETPPNLAANLAQTRVYLQPENAGLSDGMEGAAVGENGAFAFQNVGPGNYTVKVLGVPDGFYPKSIRFGDREVLDSRIDLTNGGGGALDVLLSPAGGSIEGIVTGAKQQPAGGASVILIPEPSQRDQLYRYKTSTTDQNGHFRLTGIAPGGYKVFAWEDMEAGAYLDADFLKPLEEKGQPFDIKENARESVQLKQIGIEDSAASATP